jgi:hypothetical protein
VGRLGRRLSSQLFQREKAPKKLAMMTKKTKMKMKMMKIHLQKMKIRARRNWNKRRKTINRH